MGLARGAKGLYDSYSTGSYGMTDAVQRRSENVGRGSYAVQNFAGGDGGLHAKRHRQRCCGVIGFRRGRHFVTAMPAGAARPHFTRSAAVGPARWLGHQDLLSGECPLPYVGALYAASQGDTVPQLVWLSVQPSCRVLGLLSVQLLGTIADSFLGREGTYHPSGQWEWETEDVRR